MSSAASVGPDKRCGVEECEIVDFLPFNCNRCDQVFCIHHKSSTSHPCPHPNQISTNLLICPLCTQLVHLPPNQDPNITWDSHVNSNCDPSIHQKQTKNKSCSSTRCKEKLSFSNTILCKYCNQKHCLKHKFAPDHNCTGQNLADNVLRRRNSMEIENSNGSEKLGLNLMNFASGVCASAEAGFGKLNLVTKNVIRKVKDGMKKGIGERFDLVEICVQCGDRFCDVDDLIEHVEKVHEFNLGSRGLGRIYWA